MGIVRYIDNNRENHKVFAIDPVNGTSISYSDVYTEIELFKGVLENAGFRKGDHVAVALDNSIATAVVLIGVLKLGGVIIPVNLGF